MCQIRQAACELIGSLQYNWLKRDRILPVLIQLYCMVYFLRMLQKLGAAGIHILPFPRPFNVTDIFHHIQFNEVLKDNVEVLITEVLKAASSKNTEGTSQNGSSMYNFSVNRLASSRSPEN